MVAHFQLTGRLRRFVFPQDPGHHRTLQLVALTLGIIAFSQSRRPGVSNDLALAAVVISASLLVIGGIVAIALAAAWRSV